MAGLILLVAVLLLLFHMGAICLSRALRTYSRTRLEALCQTLGVPARAEDVARHDEATERSAEVLAVLTGLGLAALLGMTVDHFVPALAAEAIVLIALVLATLGYIIAGVIGRVCAERVVVLAWPTSPALRVIMVPATWATRALDAYVYRHTQQLMSAPRPASVEIEVFSAGSADEESLEAELTDDTRSIVQRAVVLSMRDVQSVMTPRAAMYVFPEDVSAPDAARAFIDSGYSRIPLYGEHRDDIIGILYAKDLFARLFECGNPAEVVPRKLARPPFFVPESKDATELLNEMRAQRVQMAIVLDEYGTLSGLVTLEDLLEGLVGEIDDEHDRPTPTDSIVALDCSHFEVDASVPIVEINEQLGLRLPTEEGYETIGGLAFSTLNRVPEPGATFDFDGIGFTVLAVERRSIRRLRLDLHRDPVPVSSGAGSGPDGVRSES